MAERVEFIEARAAVALREAATAVGGLAGPWLMRDRGAQRWVDLAHMLDEVAVELLTPSIRRDAKTAGASPAPADSPVSAKEHARRAAQAWADYQAEIHGTGVYNTDQHYIWADAMDKLCKAFGIALVRTVADYRPGQQEGGQA